MVSSSPSFDCPEVAGEEVGAALGVMPVLFFGGASVEEFVDPVDVALDGGVEMYSTVEFMGSFLVSILLAVAIPWL
jgi:hypothetical protein